MIYTVEIERKFGYEHSKGSIPWYFNTYQEAVEWALKEIRTTNAIAYTVHQLESTERKETA